MVRKGQTGSQHRLYLENILEPPIIFYVGKGDIKGRWCKCKCVVCEKELCYWSKTGEPLLRYRFPLCEECR